MSAIQVARTDTFEQQRVKINEIGSQIFSVTQGGSDLATGNLKLGDGTRTAPSLSFTNQPSLGLFRPSPSIMRTVVDGKISSDFSLTGFYSFKDFYVQQKKLVDSGVGIQNAGSGYDAGSYFEIPSIGGTGDGALFDIVVDNFSGSITNEGINYIPGTYNSVLLNGGSGTGATADITVEDLDGVISNIGSGYVPGEYTDVPFTGGSGTGATADITITGDLTITGTIVGGSNYSQGNYASISLLNTPTETFTVTTILNPGGGTEPERVFVIDGVTQDSISLVEGNTYRFDQSDSSNLGHPITFLASDEGQLGENYFLISRGVPGNSGAFTDLVVKPSTSGESILYACQIHDGMGSSISIITGTEGQYGSGLTVDIVVSSDGTVSSVSVDFTGTGYKENDVLTLYSSDVGGTGSGFSYTLNPIVYTGIVSVVSITDVGQNYLQGDVLTVDVSEVGGNGSGFDYTITTNPGKITTFSFASSGSGYQVNDTLTLYGIIQKSTTASTLTSAVVLDSIEGISVGHIVEKVSGSGSLPNQQITVQLIDENTNEVFLSDVPTSAGSIVLNFIPPYYNNSNLFEYTINSSGSISSITVTEGGNGYTVDDVLTVDPTNLTQPITYDVTIGDIQEVEFGSQIADTEFSAGDNLRKRDGSVVAFSVSSSPATTPSSTPEIASTLDTNSTTIIVANSSGILPGMIITQDTSSGTTDTGFLGFGTNYVISVDSSTEITVSVAPSVSGTADLTFTTDEAGTFTGVSASGGSGSGATFNVQRQEDGSILSVSLNSGGYFYTGGDPTGGDTLIIPGNLIGGSTPDHDIEIYVLESTVSSLLKVHKIDSSGGFIDKIYIDSGSISSSDSLVKESQSSPLYPVSTASADISRYFIDTGSGAEYLPNLTLYVGNTYVFDFEDQSNSGNTFALAKFKDGDNPPSQVPNISAVLNEESFNIVVSDTSNLIEGMVLVITGGQGIIKADTRIVTIVDSTTITVDKLPVQSGNAVLRFDGVEYTDNVTKFTTSISIKVTDATPNLYYYSLENEDYGGEDNNESLITIDPVNPKSFGSGLEILVTDIESVDVIKAVLRTGELTSVKFIGEEAEFSGSIISDSLSTGDISSDSLQTDAILSNLGLSVTSPTISINSIVSVGSLSIDSQNGNLTTNGNITTTSSINVNNSLKLEDNIIKSETNLDVVLKPASNKLVDIDSSTAIVIPVGNTNQRPSFSSGSGDGAIRFNTESNQYEGYNSTTTSWSSLGGVRDIDGNTYILAELSAGANDNTLWFFNDNNNTLKLTSQFLDFRSVKKISSGKLGLPLFTLWTANTPVNIGQYLKYRNNIYEVTGAGTTASSGNEPSHISGVANNGTAQLTWYSSAVSPLEFTEVQELRVGPNKDCPLIVSAETKIFNNTISTLIEDLVLSPNSGKKVSINASTSLVIPVGNTNQRGSASQGSIRYNTTISQFEGYSGANWSSLGGVRDVDGNTYIIPETSPGANENILYFYNNGTNTLQLSSTSLDFTNIDTISVSSGNTLEIGSEIVTLAGSATTVDNTDNSATFISTSKQYLDLGLSSGITVDPVLRLDDEGDVYLNTGFGTGTFTGVKIFDGDLKDFELADYALKTNVISLVKGVTNTGSAILYDTSLSKGCKVTVVSKSSAGKKSMVEYSIIDNGTDIFHNEIGSLNTSLDGFTASFDISPGGETRITLVLSNDHAANDTVEITVLTQVIK